MTCPWYFVLPADRNQPSGGNRYNEQLMLALRRAGQSTDIVDFNTYQETRLADQSGYYFVDSLFIRELAALPGNPSPRKLHTIFILHHLESMDAPSDSTQKQSQAEERRAFTYVDTFLATSPFSQRYLQQQDIRQPIVVVEPGMDTPLLSREFRSEKMEALMVANLIARKGILPWLQSLSTVLQPTDAFKLTIIGRSDVEPAYAEACRQFASEEPLLRQQVHFTGALPYLQVEEHYARTRLFVSAARMETFGMALQEATAHRIPFLTLTGGFAAQHVTSARNGYAFGTLAEMADFFVNLVRSPTRLADWQADVDVQPSGTKYNWDEAAQKLIQQLN